MIKEKKLFKKTFVSITLITIILLAIFTAEVLAAESNQAMGSFKLDLPSSISVRKDDYAPIEEVADIIGVRVDWELNKGVIEGYFDRIYFEANNYVIANGQLYLPLNLYEDNFDIYIEIRGNNYYIYKRIIRPRTNLDIVLNTNKERYRRNEDMAVSVLIMNNSDRDVNLRLPSSQEYDLVLTRYNREVWRLSSGKGYLTAMGELKIPANDFKLYTDLINPSEEANIYFGTYELHVEINPSSDNTIKSDPIQIRIQ